MNKSIKTLIATVAVVGISAGSISLATANGSWGGDCGRGGQMHKQGNMQGHSFKQGQRYKQGGVVEERIADRLGYMKYQLKITEAQEPAWQTFEASVKERGAKMAGRSKQGSFKQKMPVTERIALMRTKTEQMNKMADSIEALYTQLTPEQQQLADQISPLRRMR